MNKNKPTNYKSYTHIFSRIGWENVHRHKPTISTWIFLSLLVCRGFELIDLGRYKARSLRKATHGRLVHGKSHEM